MSSANGSLPRLGSDKAAKKAELKTREVVIPDRGVTVVLRKPSLGMVIDIQERVQKRGDDDTGFEDAVALVAKMLVEPELSEDQVRAEVLEWTMPDWQILQDAAMDLAGLGEEARRAAEREFRGART